MKPTLEYARTLDEADVLRTFRERFAIPADSNGAQLLYLCGHSLGLMPVAARQLVNQELDDWARLAVLGHEQATRPWIPYHENLAAGLAYLSGARPDEVVAMNSLTVNLHLMLASFYRPSGRRVKILIEAGAFSSDRHAVASQLAWHGRDARTDLIELTPEGRSEVISEQAIEDCLKRHGDEIALVLWPGVQFRTGQAFDLARIVRAAHRAGCIAGLDLAHSIGNMPLDLHEYDADFAVWCSYKYLNAGPGAIAGCFVHERHGSNEELPRFAGWWGHDEATRFRMGPEFHAMSGAEGWQLSNPSIFAMAPLRASLELFDAVGMRTLRERSVVLTGYLEEELKKCADGRFAIITPSEPSRRGAQLSIRVGAGRKELIDSLAASGVVCDWREPDLIRAAPVPLYNSFEEVEHFVETFSKLV